MDMNYVKVLLMDIEGTTTPITFVKNFLFPYSKTYCRDYLEKTWDTDLTQKLINHLIAIQPDFQEFRDSHNISDDTITIDIASQFFCYLIDKDLKHEHLKELQGLIWERGYEDGTLAGKVYDDVPPALERLLANGLTLATYSSGSRKAQQLLLKYSEHGDLCRFVTQFFDTAVGQKFNTTSYEYIAKHLEVDPSNIVFLTDIPKEALAAKNSGMTAILVSRPGNAPLTDEDKTNFKVINDFEGLNYSLN